MAKKYKKAPAYMGKYLQVRIGNRDKTVQDHDVLTGNLDKYVELGMLVEDDGSGSVPESEPKPVAPKPVPAPTPVSAREVPSGVTRSPAAKIAEQQQKAFSKLGSGKPKLDPGKNVDSTDHVEPEKEAPEPEKKKSKPRRGKKGGRK